MTFGHHAWRNNLPPSSNRPSANSVYAATCAMFDSMHEL
jgi:hypothetical protein